MTNNQTIVIAFSFLLISSSIAYCAQEPNCEYEVVFRDAVVPYLAQHPDALSLTDQAHLAQTAKTMQMCMLPKHNAGKNILWNRIRHKAGYDNSMKAIALENIIPDTSTLDAESKAWNIEFRKPMYVSPLGTHALALGSQLTWEDGFKYAFITAPINSSTKPIIKKYTAGSYAQAETVYRDITSQYGR